MSLDPTARETNVKDSIKKYIVEKMGGYCPITFDRSLSEPILQGRKVDKWLSVIFGDLSRGYFSEITVDFFCCTRQDNEGYRNSQLVDTLVGHLTDTTQTDGMARIPFYQSHPTDPWVLIGGLIVHSIVETKMLSTEDETKYKVISPRILFASRI
jgi:hypothetical protein